MKRARLNALLCGDGEGYVWSMEIQSSFWRGACFRMERAWEKFSQDFNFGLFQGVNIRIMACGNDLNPI